MIKRQMCEHILAFDPSGNFNEGKGRTGWVLYSVQFKRVIKFGEIDAGISLTMEDHWDKHLDLIANFRKDYKNLHVVAEDYLLYNKQAISQTNSRMETPKLIGVIQFYCYKEGVPLLLQPASTVKTRWKPELLVKKGYITTTSDSRGFRSFYLNGYLVSGHTLDALKHAIHYSTFMI